MSKVQTGRVHTEESKKKMSEAHSGEKSHMLGKTGALHSCSKAIIAIKPDGTKLNFGSAGEAARELGTQQSNLSNRYLNTGYVPTRGKFKGWRFIYKNPEDF